MAMMRCISPAADLRAAPDLSMSIEDQLLFGQNFEVLKTQDGWHQGRAIGVWGEPYYEGWVEAMHFGEDVAPTHKVSSLRAPVFSRADIKSPVMMTLSLGSRLAAKTHDDEFYSIEQGYIHVNHVGALSESSGDYTAIAEQYLLLPYIWGGKSADGVDCSGLVQNAIWAAGYSCPRDSGPQSREIGEAVPITDEFENLMRGDLVFWPGHVAIMIDGSWIIHANAHHMMTQIEPLAVAVERIKKSAGDVTSIRRIML